MWFSFLALDCSWKTITFNLVWQDIYIINKWIATKVKLHSKNAFLAPKQSHSKFTIYVYKNLLKSICDILPEVWINHITPPTFGRTQFYVSLCFIPEHTHTYTYIYLFLLINISQKTKQKRKSISNWFISCSTGIFPLLASSSLFRPNSRSYFFWQIILHSEIPSDGLFYISLLSSSDFTFHSNYCRIQLVWTVDNGTGEQWDASISLYQY